MELNRNYEEWFSSKNTFRYVIVATLIFFLFLFFKKIVLLAVLLIFVMIVEVLVHHFKSPIHLDFLPFLSLFITVEYGLGISIVFVIIGGMLAEIAIKHFEPTDNISQFLVVGVNIVFSAMLCQSFLPAAILAVFAYFVLQIIVAFLLAAPNEKLIAEPPLMLVINLLLVWRVSDFLFMIAH